MSLSPIEEWYEKYLKPSEKGCKWCKAKGECPAMAKANFYAVVNIAKATDEGLEDLDAEIAVQTTSATDQIEQSLRRIPHLSLEEMERFYEAIPMMNIWIEAIEGRMRTEMLQGYKSTKYKLVKGRDGKRKWNDPEEIENILKAMRLNEDEKYDKSLKSPTSMEKMMKGRPKLWSQLKNKISRSSGGILVAPFEDNRESYDPFGEALALLPDYTKPTKKVKTTDDNLDASDLC